MESNNTTGEPQCAPYDPYSLTRFLLIIATSSVALIGVGTNFTLTAVFCRLTKAEKSSKTTHLYLLILSIFDAFFCYSFSVLFGLDALAIYFRSPFLFQLYFLIVLPVFLGSQIVQLGIPYLIVFATVEKWIVSYRSTEGPLEKLTQIITSSKARIMFVGVVFLICSLRLPTAWAYKIVHKNCTDIFGTQQLYPTDLFNDPTFRFVDFYIIMALDVFVPFLSLLALNYGILNNMRVERARHELWSMSGQLLNMSFAVVNTLSYQGAANDSLMMTNHWEESNEFDKQEEKAKQTTVSIFAIVTSYLLCTAPSFVLSILEHSRPSLLVHEDGSSNNLYMIWGDLVSVLFMVNSLLSIFIFYICDNRIKNEIKQMFCIRSHVSVL